MKAAYGWWLQGGSAPLPPAPTRDQVCNIKLSFQGLTVTLSHNGMGPTPMFEACLAWLPAVDRQALYAAKHAAGDTHCIIDVPVGAPLYDEGGQPFGPDNFPALDWTNGLTALTPDFINLVVEVIMAGFVPAIFMDETQANSIVELPLVLNALKAYPGVDLTQYCIVMPGWDGVWYGWQPQQITDWVNLARSIAPNGYFGIEMQPRIIHLGGGPADWVYPTGGLSGFDTLLHEWSNLSTAHSDETWDVGPRVLGPAWRSPSDLPAGYPIGPWYWTANPTPRGPYFACAFEYAEYQWIRGQVSSADVQNARAYLQGCGWSGLG